MAGNLQFLQNLYIFWCKWCNRKSDWYKEENKWTIQHPHQSIAEHAIKSPWKLLHSS